MRLPPPSRRYSPISVMAETLETVSCPNSASMASRSSCRSSKISFPLMVDGVLNRFLSPISKVLHHRGHRGHRENKIRAFKLGGAAGRLPGACRGSLARWFSGVPPHNSELRFLATPSSVFSVPPVVKFLVRTIIRKLQIDAEVARAQQGNDLLQGVAVLAAHAHQVSLN